MVFLGIFVCPGENDIGIALTGVGDEDLGAVEDPVVAVAHGGRSGASGIGAGGGLGQTEAAHLFTFGQGHEEFLLLLLGAEQVDRVGAEGEMGRQGHPGRGADPGQFLDSNRIADIIGSGPAIFLRKDDAGQAEFGQPVKHQLPVKPFLFVTFRSRGGHLLFGKTPHHIADQPLFFGVLEMHWSCLHLYLTQGNTFHHSSAYISKVYVRVKNFPAFLSPYRT